MKRIYLPTPFPPIVHLCLNRREKTVILLPFSISMVGSFKKKKKKTNGKDIFPPSYCVPFRLLRGWSRRNRNHCNLTWLLDPNIWHFCHLGVRLVNTTITMSVKFWCWSVILSNLSICSSKKKKKKKSKYLKL